MGRRGGREGDPEELPPSPPPLYEDGAMRARGFGGEEGEEGDPLRVVWSTTDGTRQSKGENCRDCCH